MKTLKEFYPTKRKFIFLGLLALLAAHLPFLAADPDQALTGSRGPYTDEGLMTCQVRSYINQGSFGIDKSDNLIKTPLLSALVFPSFKLFGTTRLVGRLTFTLLCLSILWLIASRDKYFEGWMLLSIPMVMLEYGTFQFTHFTLAEVLASLCIVGSLAGLAKVYATQSISLLSFLLPHLLVAAAYSLKIQFAYAALLPPFAAVLIGFRLFKKGWRSMLKPIILSAVISCSLFCLYILVWYLPFKEVQDLVLSDQLGNRFASSGSIWGRFKFNFEFYLLSTRWLALTACTGFAILSGLALATRKHGNMMFNGLFYMLCCWLVLECHNLLIVHVPTRYLISLFISMACVCSAVSWELLKNQAFGKLISMAIILAISIPLIGSNTSWLVKSYADRSYKIEKMNRYLKNYSLQDELILGAWATSAAWDSKAQTWPVWGGYFNHENILSRFKPRAVITELDEQDAHQAFLNDGIDLKSQADSVRYFSVYKWELGVYWLKP